MIVYKGDAKINAIKAVREMTGLGLKDSKDAMEQGFDVIGLDEPTVRDRLNCILHEGTYLPSRGSFEIFCAPLEIRFNQTHLVRR